MYDKSLQVPVTRIPFHLIDFMELTAYLICTEGGHHSRRCKYFHSTLWLSFCYQGAACTLNTSVVQEIYHLIFCVVDH